MGIDRGPQVTGSRGIHRENGTGTEVRSQVIGNRGIDRERASSDSEGDVSSDGRYIHVPTTWDDVGT